MDKDRERTIIVSAIVLTVVAILGIMAVLGIYSCPFKLVFGIPCPLCGITRAMMALVRGSFAEAFYYHPLWPLILSYGLILVLSELRIISIKKPWNDILPIVVAFLLLICYFVRFATHTSV